MKRLNESIIKKIQELNSLGKKQVEIAQELGVCQGTVSYWTGGEELRKRRSQRACKIFRNKPKSEKKRIYKKRGQYLRTYLRKRYHEDEVFRLKQINRSKEYQRRKSGDRRRSKEIRETTQGIEV